jgi:hypothetical protein
MRKIGSPGQALSSFYHGCRVRLSKNFMGVLNRTTKRLGIRDEENLISRSLKNTYNRKACLEDNHPDPATHKGVAHSET